MWHVSFFAATELLADADVSEGATKKKQTRGNDKMNAVIVIHNSLFLIAMSWLIFHLYRCTVHCTNSVR